MDPLMQLLSQGWYYWLVIGLQGLCIIHVLRTGRDLYWIFIILFIPLIGSLIYLYLHGRGLRVFNPAALLRIPMLDVLNDRAIEQDWRVQQSLDNRISWAEVLLRRGQQAEARRLLEEELNGPFRQNVNLLFAYARVCYVLGDFAEAISRLEIAAKVPNNDRLRQRNLLRALCHERLGDAVSAEACFKEAQGGFIGEEAKVRYGEFLLAQGRADEARRQFQRVVEALAISSWGYRREQKLWHRLARQRLAALDRPSPAVPAER